MSTTRKRKPRSDRNHVLYQITCTATDEYYIGITVATGGAKKALQRRIDAHIHRALNEKKDWNLCKAIRQYGPSSFTIDLIEIVRGKAAAHTREVAYLRTLNPVLNTA